MATVSVISGSNRVSVEVPDGASVADALAAAGAALGTGQRVALNSQPVEPTVQVAAGDRIVIAGTKSAGR